MILTYGTLFGESFVNVNSWKEKKEFYGSNARASKGTYITMK